MSTSAYKRATAIVAIWIIAVGLITILFRTGNFGIWLFATVLSFLAACTIESIVRGAFRRRRSDEVSKRHFALNIIGRFMALFFITGTIISMLAFPLMVKASGQYTFNNTELILRSMICSLDMFMLDVDSNVLDRLDSYPLVKGFMLVQATLSFMCTVSMLVALVFTRLVAFLKLRYKTRVSADKCHIYLFFGVNDNSLLLAHEIGHKDSQAIVIFADSANVSEEDNDSWNSVVSLFTHRQESLDKARHAGADITITPKRPDEITDRVPPTGDTDVLGLLNLVSVRNLIAKLPEVPDKSEPSLHIFFLSNDEDANIAALKNLARDTTVRCFAAGSDRHQRVALYCHARANSANKVLEDIGLTHNLDVKIIDSSHLAVEMVKAKPEFQPVRVATFSESCPELAAEPLHALVVGFGEVGRDAFRFLYEFGTFIGLSDGKPTTFRPHITAVDSRMDVLAGPFMAGTPAISYGDSLALKKMDTDSREFYDKVLSEANCRSLNYIVLALGDDDANISLAINIFNLIRRVRENLDNLIIMVRCTSDDKLDMMQRIAEHYNRGCGTPALNVINIFGNPRGIYDYCIVIRDSLLNESKEYLDRYNLLNGGGKTWEQRRKGLTGADEPEQGKEVYPQIDSLRELHRKESQDMANAKHKETKLWLLRKALGDTTPEDFAALYFDADGIKANVKGRGAGIRFPGLDAIDRGNEIVLHLAMLEHARWNAAHELLGYTVNNDDTTCDERTMRHNCLRDWTELDNESKRKNESDKAKGKAGDCDYKIYDFGVVSTSLSLEVRPRNPLS